MTKWDRNYKITNYKSYLKVGQVIYNKVSQSLPQSWTGITKWGNFIRKWGNYYKEDLYTFMTPGDTCLLIGSMRFESEVV